MPLKWPEHHDDKGAHAVGDDRHQTGGQNERGAAPVAVIGEVGIQHAERDRGDDVTHPAAAFHNIPRPGGQREEHAVQYTGMRSARTAFTVKAAVNSIIG